MTKFRTITLGLLLSLSGASIAFAQTGAAGRRAATDDATVTISISAKGVRFSAPGSVGQVRLEVFDADGASVYNSEFQPGNVRDWPLLDKQGQTLPDGSYLCMVTVRGLSKRMSVKQGTVVIQDGQASLQLSEGEAVGPVESEKSLAQVSTTDDASAGTLLAHDGKVGQVISTRGALTFRVGDFFGGKDKELMRLTPEGNLGVGVATPQAMLDVAGTIRARGGIRFDDGTLLTSASSLASATQSTKTGGVKTDNNFNVGTPGSLVKWVNGAKGLFGSSSIVEKSDNIGIGTQNPTQRLEVAGSIKLGGGSLIFTDGTSLNTAPASLTGDAIVGAINDPATAKTINDTRLPANIARLNATNTWAAANNFSAGLSAGGASITNVASPAVATDAANKSYVDSNVASNKSYVDLNFATKSYVDTTFPTKSFVDTTFAAKTYVDSTFAAKSYVDTTFALKSYVDTTFATKTYVDTTFPTKTYVDSTFPTKSYVDTTFAAKTYVDSTFGKLNGANLWTGANTFSTGLDVAGDLRVTGNAIVNGNIAAKYQDVAEWVPARQKIAAGTVVILDTTRTNGVAPSARRYDTHVAGVVSAQPGLILGQGGEGQVLVATTGRVKVKVDATLYPIKIGDLLVSSDTPGSAMKSQPMRVAGNNRLHRPGTIIGKALEPLAGGKGEILVLLSLQ